MVDISNTSDKSPIASKDRAETFEESDVSVSHNRTQVSSGSVEMGTESSVSGSEINTQATSDRAYNSIVPNREIISLTVSTGSNWNGADLVLWDSDMSVLDRISGTTKNNQYTLSADMNAGKEYRLGFEDQGNVIEFDVIEDMKAPVSSELFDITVSSYFDYIVFPSITAAVAERGSGTAFVEWPYPHDIYRWDAATFQTSEDGETVQVYVEESTDGGSTWSEIQGPISRGDQIEADPKSRVRFRVELSRSNNSNNPSLDAIYRRWVL